VQVAHSGAGSSGSFCAHQTALDLWSLEDIHASQSFGKLLRSLEYTISIKVAAEDRDIHLVAIAIPFIPHLMRFGSLSNGFSEGALSCDKGQRFTGNDPDANGRGMKRFHFDREGA
ncbi:hypothetical protein ACRCPG_10435, partial [Pseudomonas aeruginosa]